MRQTYREERMDLMYVAGVLLRLTPRHLSIDDRVVKWTPTQYRIMSSFLAPLRRGVHLLVHHPEQRQLVSYLDTRVLQQQAGQANYQTLCKQITLLNHKLSPWFVIHSVKPSQRIGFLLFREPEELIPEYSTRVNEP